MSEEAHVSISFDGEASETFSNLLSGFQGYCVQLTPQDGGEPFDAIIHGNGIDSGWYDAVQFIRADEHGEEIPGSTPETLRVSRVHVY